MITAETRHVETNPVSRPFWVHYKLREIGSSVTAIAAEQGCSSQAVSMALHFGNSASLEAAIAAKLGLTARQLFPERFDASGNRYRFPLLRKISTARRASARSNGVAG